MDNAGRRMDPIVLFEDEALLVIDKPPGMVVDRSEPMREWTVQDWAEGKLRLKVSDSESLQTRRDKGQRTNGRQPSAFFSRAGIVHRLDKETSGCLVIAKNPTAFAGLQRQFKARTVKKEYTALVHGIVKPSEGTIRVPLARSRIDRQRFTVSVGGRSAETAYRVERAYIREGKPYSLLTIRPKTGRTHQIRVHVRYIGHPIVADQTYGGEKRSKEDREWCPRLFLHAKKIFFIHPVKKSIIAIESPLPEDLRLVLSNLSR